MRFLSYALLMLVALAAGAGAFIYVAMPTDFVRDEMVALVRSHTGRSLTVAGPVSISLYPSLAVELHDVTLSPPPGMSGEALLSMPSLALKMPLWPLLQHQISIEQFALNHPVISFRIDKDGRRSWDFGDGDEAAKHNGTNVLRGTRTGPAITPAAGSTAPAPASNGAQTQITNLAGLELHDVRINNGTIHFIDDRTGLSETLTDVSVNVSLDSLEGAAITRGSVTYRGEALDFEATAEASGRLLTNAPSAVSLTAKGRRLDLSLKGRLALADAVPLTGKVDLKAVSLRELLQWVRHPLPAGSGFGPTEMTAAVALSAAGVKAQDLIATVDGYTGKGSVAADFGKAKAVLHANLALDHLDLNTYLSTANSAETQVQLAQSSAAKPGKDVGKPNSKTVVATDAGQGWNTVPIDLSALRFADADISLALGSLKYRDIKVGRTALTTTVKDGIMRIRFAELQLYDGKGTGNLVVDAHVPALAKLEASFSLRGVQTQPFLADATGFKQLAGRGNITFGFTGSGRSQRDFITTLMGQGRMELADGAIVGTDIPQVVRALQKGNISSWKDEPTATTDFSSMTASCTITNGVLSNDDLVLAGPLLRMKGSGTVSLIAQTLDYTAQPMVVGTLEGQGASADAAGALDGIAIPVHVSGPWAKPNVDLDLAAIARNPDAVVSTVKKALAKVKGGDQVQSAIDKLAASKEGKAIGALIGGLLGKIAPDANPPADQPPQQ